ncbi:MAG: isomerase [bacterium]|nr:isomerase [bacterium]
MSKTSIHPGALCESENIGAGTRIEAFAHVAKGARIGREARIAGHSLVEGGAVIGDRVVIESGVQVWSGVRVEDDAFVGPNVAFTNRPLPRSDDAASAAIETVVEHGASIGANATILPGITIGRNATIGAGAVVTRSVPPNAIVIGNPARIAGYVGSAGNGESEATETEGPGEVGVRPARVAGVTVHRMPLVRDIRGSLVANEFGDDIPFEPRRSFLVIDVPSAEIRGEHAHRQCHQFLTCIRGACSLVADDGREREEFRLDHPTLGVHIPPWIWSTQFRHTHDAVLLVYASHHYDPDDYIRDYPTFLEEVSARR